MYIQNIKSLSCIASTHSRITSTKSVWEQTVVCESSQVCASLLGGDQKHAAVMQLSGASEKIKHTTPNNPSIKLDDWPRTMGHNHSSLCATTLIMRIMKCTGTTAPGCPWGVITLYYYSRRRVERYGDSAHTIISQHCINFSARGSQIRLIEMWLGPNIVLCVMRALFELDSIQSAGAHVKNI